MVLAVKHCPNDHHDWAEVLKLTAALSYPSATDHTGHSLEAR